MRRIARTVSTVALLAPLAGHAAAAQQANTPRWAAAVDSMMRREMARTRTPGAQIAIVERGRLVYTKGYGVADLETGRPVSEHTLFQTGSVGKLFTGVLVAQLASAGVVDLRAPAATYAPEIAGREARTVTLHELLTHTAGWRTAGVPWGRSDDAALGEAWRTVGDTFAVPGLRGIYSYSNPSFEMAAYVAERAAGRPFATLLDSLVLRPLGMPRSTLRPMVAMTHDFSLGYGIPGLPVVAAAAIGPSAWGSPPAVVRPMPGNSAEWGAGFLWTSAAETARLTMAMMDGGMLEGRRVLAADAARAVTTGYAARGGSRFLQVGYGMNTDSVGGRRLWQKGGLVDGFRALATMWPAEKLAVVVIVNLPSDLTYQATGLAAQIVAGIAPPPPATPPAEREPTAAERAALVGAYRIGRRTLEIHEANGRLELRRIVYSVPIRMTGADRFVITPPNDGPVEYVIVRDSAGAVRYLTSREQAYPRVTAP